jgi:hypothetical protein
MNKLFFLLMLLISTSAYSQDFKLIKENMTKANIIKIAGSPTKILTSTDKSSSCFIWYRKDSAWCVFLHNDISTSDAGPIDDLVSGILELRASLSNFNTTNVDNEPKKPDPISNNSQNALLETIKKQIEIQILDAKIIKTWSDETKAGCRLKIKNLSSYTIYDLNIIIYYFDKNDKIFYEEAYYPVNSNSWTDRLVLKPNYSILYPSDQSNYLTASNIDVSEWQEGKVKVEIAKINIEEPKK